MIKALVPNGNICITFEDHAARGLIKFANKYFAGMADGYLLGSQSVPHITISHFHHDKPQPRALRRDLGNIVTAMEPLQLDKLKSRAGTKAHDGYIWMEFGVAPTPPLVDLKNKVDAILRSYDITILTPSAPDWHPHLTVCRIKKDTRPVATDALKYNPDLDTTLFHLALGASDENGQFQKTFWQRPLA